MTHRVFVTHIVPKDMIEKLPVSPAGNYFSYNLISGNLFDEVISLIPTNIKTRLKIRDKEVRYIQNRLFSHCGIFKALNIFLENIQLVFSIKRNSNVWFYNLTIHTIGAFLILRYLRKSVKTYIIVLDYMPTVSIFSLQSFILRLIHNTNGIISLTQNPALNNKNRLVISGVVPNNTRVKRMSDINNKFLLSGLLSKKRSPELIFKIFSEFSEYELIVTGRVYDTSLIEQYQVYPNIRFLGLLTYDKYIEILEDCTFCINSRNPAYKDNEFNFPSKLIEYLLNNKIVISTMQYPEIRDLNYFYVEHDFNSLVDFLHTISIFDEQLLLSQYANQSQRILKKFGTEQWRKSFDIIENIKI
jgi:glycosyltransferase involved in cell wall biosynthesis